MRDLYALLLTNAKIKRKRKIQLKLLTNWKCMIYAGIPFLCKYSLFMRVFPFYTGLFCTFSSPQAAIYSHQSRPEARPSLLLTYTTTLTNFIRLGIIFLKLDLFVEEMMIIQNWLFHKADCKTQSTFWIIGQNIFVYINQNKITMRRRSV